MVRRVAELPRSAWGDPHGGAVLALGAAAVRALQQSGCTDPASSRYGDWTKPWMPSSSSRSTPSSSTGRDCDPGSMQDSTSCTSTATTPPSSSSRGPRPRPSRSETPGAPGARSARSARGARSTRSTRSTPGGQGPRGVGRSRIRGSLPGAHRRRGGARGVHPGHPCRAGVRPARLAPRPRSAARPSPGSGGHRARRGKRDGLADPARTRPRRPRRRTRSAAGRTRGLPVARGGMRAGPTPSCP